jgi:GH35 family endo-1,4-beta-xylanase
MTNNAEQQRKNVSNEVPAHTWGAVIAALEFDVAAIRYEEATLNFNQAEFLAQYTNKLARALEAQTAGVPVADWVEAEAQR